MVKPLITSINYKQWFRFFCFKMLLLFPPSGKESMILINIKLYCSKIKSILTTLSVCVDLFFTNQFFNMGCKTEDRLGPKGTFIECSYPLPQLVRPVFWMTVSYGRSMKVIYRFQIFDKMSFFRKKNSLSKHQSDFKIIFNCCLLIKTR